MRCKETECVYYEEDADSCVVWQCNGLDCPTLPCEEEDADR